LLYFTTQYASKPPDIHLGVYLCPKQSKNIDGSMIFDYPDQHESSLNPDLLSRRCRLLPSASRRLGAARVLRRALQVVSRRCFLSGRRVSCVRSGRRWGVDMSLHGICSKLGPSFFLMVMFSALQPIDPSSAACAKAFLLRPCICSRYFSNNNLFILYSSRQRVKSLVIHTPQKESSSSPTSRREKELLWIKSNYAYFTRLI